MNYLKVSQRLAEFTDPMNVGRYDSHIAAIGIIMQLLTFGLLVSFGAVAIKKTYVRLSSEKLDLDAIRQRVVSMIFSRGGQPAAGTPAPREQELAPRNTTTLPTTMNPMHAECKLPEVWQAVTTEDGQTYYHNTETGETSWTWPEETASFQTGSGCQA